MPVVDTEGAGGLDGPLAGGDDPFTKAGRWGPDSITDNAGNVLVGASVFVYYTNGVDLAPLYSDETREAQVDNPTLVDSVGNVDFFAAPGTYRVKVISSGSVLLDDEVVVNPHPEEWIVGFPSWGNGVFDVTHPNAGAVGDGVTDDTAAIQAAIDAAEAAGGGLVRATAVSIAIAGAVVIPANVDLQGAGKNATTFLCTTATSSIEFGSLTATGRYGGESGHFTIDGGGVCDVAMYVGIEIERNFTAIDIQESGDVGLLIEDAQNCLFQQVNVQNCVGDGIVIDYGAAGNVFVRCEFGRNGGWSGTIRSTGTSPAGHGAPSLNLFVRCIFERMGYQHDDTGPGLFRQTAGAFNRAYMCSWSDVDIATEATDKPYLALSGGSSFVIDGGNIHGDATYGIGIEVDGATLIMSGRPHFQTLKTALSSKGVAIIDVSPLGWIETTVTNRFVTDGAKTFDQAVRTRPLNLTQYEKESAGTLIQGQVAGDSKQRLVIEHNKISMGDGATTADAYIERVAANQFATSDDIGWLVTSRGPVLRDTADGNYYRVRSTNGALVLQNLGTSYP